MTDFQDLDSAVAAFSSAESALRQLADRSDQTTTTTEQLAAARAGITKLRARLRDDLGANDAAPPIADSPPVGEVSPTVEPDEQVVDLRAATEALVETATSFHERSAAELLVLCDSAELLDQAYRDLGTAERILADAHTAIREMILVHSDISRELKLSATALAALKPEGLTIRLDEINWGIGDSHAKLTESVTALAATQTDLLSAKLDVLTQSQAQETKSLRRWVRVALFLVVVTLVAVIGFGATTLLG